MHAVRGESDTPAHGILGGMAKEQKTPAKKEPGRIRQMVQIYRTTKVQDRNLPYIMLLCFIAPILVAVLLAFLLNNSIFGWIMWPLTGILVGLLIAMIVLGRRAEAVAYRQIEGKPGAVGAVVQGALRRSWRGSEVPIAITRNQDAIYRVIGRGGVVLIAEGSAQRTKRLLIDEERKVKRVLPNVKITQLYVGTDEGGIPVSKLNRSLAKIKPTLRRNEVQAVFNRLSSLQGTPVGIPKGIDPNKVRAQRPR